MRIISFISKLMLVVVSIFLLYVGAVLQDFQIITLAFCNIVLLKLIGIEDKLG